MRALLLRRTKYVDADGDLVELVLWQVPRSAAYPDGLRYRLAFVPAGAEAPGILYDNHHPKGGTTMKGRIEIERLEDGIQDFRAAWKAAAAGKPVTPRQGTYFTSLEAARKVLTPKRLELLRAIRRQRPASISQLAQLLGRDFKNVHADVQALARYGLVSLTTTRAGRRASTPRVPFSALEFRIAV